MSSPNDVLAMVYASVRNRTGMGFEAYAEAVKGYDVLPILEGQELIGGVLLKRNELHVGCIKKPKASARRYIREYLNKVLDIYGFAITSVQTQNSVGMRFCQRLGFVKVSEDNGICFLRCDRSNYR